MLPATLRVFWIVMSFAAVASTDAEVPPKVRRKPLPAVAAVPAQAKKPVPIAV